MSAHAEIQAKYLAMQSRVASKRQQGLTPTDVPLNLGEGIELVKLMLKLAEEVSRVQAQADDSTSMMTPKAGPPPQRLGEGVAFIRANDR